MVFGLVVVEGVVVVFGVVVLEGSIVVVFNGEQVMVMGLFNSDLLPISATILFLLLSPLLFSFNLPTRDRKCGTWALRVMSPAVLSIQAIFFSVFECLNMYT